MGGLRTRAAMAPATRPVAAARCPQGEGGGRAEKRPARTAARAIGHRHRRRSAAHQHFGLIVASCERADLRPVPDGVMVYGDFEERLEPLPAPAIPRAEVIDELYDAVVLGRRRCTAARGRLPPWRCASRLDVGTGRTRGRAHASGGGAVARFLVARMSEATCGSSRRVRLPCRSPMRISSATCGSPSCRPRMSLEAEQDRSWVEFFAGPQHSRRSCCWVS